MQIVGIVCLIIVILTHVVAGVIRTVWAFWSLFILQMFLEPSFRVVLDPEFRLGFGGKAIADLFPIAIRPLKPHIMLSLASFGGEHYEARLHWRLRHAGNMARSVRSFQISQYRQISN